jgi:hypothetical protein
LMSGAQMTGDRRFGSKLKEQLDFIKRSCDAYDRGNVEEALRIAIALRIIFHDKGDKAGSKSLLKHLGQPEIKIMSVAEDIDRHDRFFAGLTKLVLDPAHLRQEFVPKLASAAVKRMVSVEQWWERDIVFQDPENHFTINRRDLVLAAANKDGGRTSMSGSTLGTYLSSKVRGGP